MGASGQPFGKMQKEFEDRRIHFSSERKEQYQDLKIPLKEQQKPQHNVPIKPYPDTLATSHKPLSDHRLPGTSYFFEKIGLNKCNQEQPKTFGEMTLDHDESLILPEMLGASQIFQEVVQGGVSGLGRGLDAGEGAEST